MKIPEYLQRELACWLSTSRYIDPPGCSTTFLETPYCCGQNQLRESIELGVFHQHRFAFHYWAKWKRKYCGVNRIEPDAFEPPDLLTMDWHNDFRADSDFLEKDIRALNQANFNEVALFSWLCLPKLNDGQIYPAVKLNLLGDVYQITKSGRGSPHMLIQDVYGNPHHIYQVKGLKSFANRCDGRNGIYWDIDLDYFTSGSGDRESQRVMPETQIKRVFQKNDEAVRLILRGLHGITVALEPEYSGGLTSALNLFKIWEDIFFTGSVTKPFSNHTWRKKYLL